MMLGSPFYYDVLFDEEPGEVPFHDCMWSGICSCCIAMFQQDTCQFVNESPDLKLEDSHCRTQINHVASANAPQLTQQTTTSASSLHHHTQPLQQHQHQPQLINQTGCRISPDNPASISQAARALSNSPLDANSRRTCPEDSSSSSTSIAASAAVAAGLRATASSLASTDNSSTSSSSTSSSPAPAQQHHHANSASSLSPNCNSHSASPKPIRRREHNDSERKRRDHLRNAFNFLRDQVPRFKTISKKPPRIQILHEATKYVQIVMKEAEELERRLQAERAKHELNMRLSMK